VSNVQWRKFRAESLLLIEEMKQEILTLEFSNELDRISSLFNESDYISAAPIVYSQAPIIDSSKLSQDVQLKYQKILESGKRFK